MSLASEVTVHAVKTDEIVHWLSWFNDAFPFVGVLLIIMALDIATGITAAAITKKLNSSASYAGMSRKVVILMAVGFGAALETIAAGIPVSKLVAIAYTITESISIVENIARAGVPVPVVLIDLLEKVRSQEDTRVLNPEPRPRHDSTVIIQKANQVRLGDNPSAVITMTDEDREKLKKAASETDVKTAENVATRGSS